MRQVLVLRVLFRQSLFTPEFFHLTPVTVATGASFLVHIHKSKKCLRILLDKKLLRCDVTQQLLKSRRRLIQISNFAVWQKILFPAGVGDIFVSLEWHLWLSRDHSSIHLLNFFLPSLQELDFDDHYRSFPTKNILWYNDYFTPYYSLIKGEMANPFLSPSHHELSLLPAARKTAELQTMPRNLSQIWNITEMYKKDLPPLLLQGGKESLIRNFKSRNRSEFVSSSK